MVAPNSVYNQAITGSFDIRPGTAADASEIDRLLRILAESLGVGDKHQSTKSSVLRDGFGSEPKFSTLLAVASSTEADQNGDPVAAIVVGLCVYLLDYSTSRAGAGVYVLDLVVDPRFRGRRIGLEPMKAAIIDGQSRWNAEYVILSVATLNAGAQRFYRRHGFVIDESSITMSFEHPDRLLET